MQTSHRIFICAAFVVLASSAHTSAADRNAAEPGKKYVYKQSGGKPREMEIYFPPGWKAGGEKVPGVIMFHGGGWTGGDLSQFRSVCKYLAGRGLVAATVEYRMYAKPEIAKLPAGESNKRVCITDAKSAIRWFKQHADELGIDANRVITGGGSAGGHLAVLSTINPGLNDPADPKDIDTKVVAYLLFNPAFKLDLDAADPEVDMQAQLKADLPPAIVFFGAEDETWKPGGDALIAKLKSLGDKDTEYWIAPGQKHGFFNHQPWSDLTLTEADRFLVEHGFLKGASTLPPSRGPEKLIKQ